MSNLKKKEQNYLSISFKLIYSLLKQNGNGYLHTGTYHEKKGIRMLQSCNI